MIIKKGFMTEVPRYLPVSVDVEPRRKRTGLPMGEVLGLGTASEIDEEADVFADVPTIYTSTHEAEQELAPCVVSKNPLEVLIRWKIHQGFIKLLPIFLSES